MAERSAGRSENPLGFILFSISFITFGLLFIGFFINEGFVKEARSVEQRVKIVDLYETFKDRTGYLTVTFETDDKERIVCNVHSTNIRRVLRSGESYVYVRLIDRAFAGCEIISIRKVEE